MFTDAPSENVDWEVRRKGCSRKEHCGRGDILRSLFDTDIMIAEVKRYRGQSTTDDVNAQLRGYERELRGYGLSVRRDPSFRNANGSGVIGAFVDDDGRTNVLENAQVFIDHPLREQGEDAPWCICILS